MYSLFMSKLVTKIVVVFCAFSFVANVPAFANEKVNKILEVSSDSLIEIKHVSGQAKIIGWDKNQIKVEGELGDKTKEFRFERDGKSVIIEIEVEKRKDGWGWGNDSDSGDDLLIHVPKNSRVDYHSPNADLSIENVFGGSDIDMINGDLNATQLTGRIRLKTVNGDIRGRQLAGELTLDAVNGDIRAEHVKGDEVSVNSVNGDINVRSSAKEVRAETVNGDIEIILGDVIEVETNTVNGNIDMEMNLVDGGTVKGSSVSGGIKLAFQEGVQAKFDLEAHADGNIRNRITNQKASKAKHGSRKWLEFSTGEPSAWVDVSTVNGRIEVSSRD